MTPARKRRWFRFSLRTLFVAVTVAALWLGWHFGPIHQRQVMRRFIQEIEGEVIVDLASEDSDMPTGDFPQWRRFFGDERADFIALPKDATDAQVHRVKKLFPEAQVLRATWDAHGNYRRWK